MKKIAIVVVVLLIIILNSGCNNQIADHGNITQYGENGIIINKWNNCLLRYHDGTDLRFTDSAGNRISISGTYKIE